MDEITKTGEALAMRKVLLKQFKEVDEPHNEKHCLELYARCKVNVAR